MAHQQKLKERSIERLIRELAVIAPTDLEYTAYALTQLIENRPLIHRGVSVNGRPTGYTVDVFDLAHDVIAECSAQAGYFAEDFGKISNDIDHAKEKNDQCSRLYLYSTEICPNGQWAKLAKTLATKQFGQCAISVYDARLAATLIFEKVVEANNQLDQLADFLPCLRQLFDEYIFEQGTPARPADFISDPARLKTVADAFNASPIINLWGLSGSGKTYAAIEYVATNGAPFAATLWLSGDDLDGVTDLRAIPVQRLGTKLNLAYQLREHACLLVVDSYESDFAALAGLLQNNLHPDTRVLITSQIRAPNFPNCELPELSDATVTALLQAGPNPPTDAIVTRVRETVGRHPLVLAVLRDTICEQTGLTWPVLLDDIHDNLGRYETPRNETVIIRILGRHQAGIVTELHLLRWLDSSLLDARFIEQFLGIAGTQKLFRRSIIKPADRAYVRLHDLIRICLNRFDTPPPAGFDPAMPFWDYFRKNWEASPYHFQRSLHLHRSKVEATINPDRPVPGLQAYLCLLLRSEAISSVGLDFLAASPLELHLVDLIATGCIIEAIERQWQRDDNNARLQAGIDRITVALSTALSVPLRLDLLHHRGKFHRWLRQWTEAQGDFESVLAMDSRRWPARLQLARILRGGKKPGATDHLRAIYDAFEADEYSVPSTVILAALTELGFDDHRVFRTDFLQRRLDLLKRAVALSLVEGFSQPYQVLGRIGRHLSYTQPRVLIELVAEVGFPLPGEAVPFERFEIAECLKVVGKAHGEENSDPSIKRRWCNRALEYYERVANPNHYQLTMYAECCMLVEDFRRADGLLNQVSIADRGPHWWHRLAQAKRGQIELDDALKAVTEALGTLTEERYRSAFLLERAEIEAAQDNPACLATLREAHLLAAEEKFKRQLWDRRDTLRSRFSS